MQRTFLRHIFLFFILLASLFFQPLEGQNFYSDFGQNRIQHRQFEWKFLTRNNITVYYYDSLESIATLALSEAQASLEHIETTLSYKFGGNIRLQLFSGLKDYRQSNVGYVNPQYNTGGFTIIPNDINTLYYNGNQKVFRKLICKSVADIFLREMLYGGTLQDRLQSSANFNTPKWFIDGLADYLSENWNSGLENRLRDGLNNHGFKNFNILPEEDLELVGHSFWRFLVQTEGNSSITNIIYFLRYTHNVDDAMFFQTKKKLHQLIKDWRNYYLAYFLDDKLLSMPRGNASISKKIARLKCTDLKLSPDGKKIAIVTNDHGRFSVWIYDIKTSKTRHLYNGGSRILNQVADYSFPKLHFGGAKSDKLGMFIYQNNKYYFLEFNINNGQKRKFDLPPSYNIVDFAYSETGDSLLFSIIRSELNEVALWKRKDKNWKILVSDSIYKYNLIWRNNELFFLGNDKHLSYIAEYNTDHKQYSVLYKQENKIDFSSLVRYNDSVYGFLSDASGLTNAYVLNKHSNEIKGLTNYRRSILAQDISNDKSTFLEMLNFNGLNTFYVSQAEENPEKDEVKVKLQKWKTQNTSNVDSLKSKDHVQVVQLFQTGRDSIVVQQEDTTSKYENKFKFQVQYPVRDYTDAVSSRSYVKKEIVLRGIAKSELNIDYFITQFDNKVIGTSYYYNQMPLSTLRNVVLTPLIKASLSDYNRNFILEGGFRTSFNFDQTDYFLRADYLKNRIDHFGELNRRVRRYSVDNFYYESMHSLAFYKIVLPLDERLKINLGGGFRKDNITTKATEVRSLNVGDKTDQFALGSLELIYDNSISLGLNLSKGLKSKLWLESANNLKAKGQMLNAGVDFRHNLLLFKRVIWANRFSGLYALGNRYVATYLGGTENWTAKDQLQSQVFELKGSDYFFQQYAANLRGFARGVRVGSSYMLLNSEMRFSIQRIFLRHTSSSELIRTLQFVLFADAGTAFTGAGPNSPNNPFNTLFYTYPNYNLSVTSARNPFVVGRGYGVRLKLWGYYVRYDVARGYIEKNWGKRMSYLSLGLDF